MSVTSGFTVGTPTLSPSPNPTSTSSTTSLDPIEEHNLAHPSHADDRSRALQQRMLTLLIEQLDAKRLTPSAGEVPGYRPPAVSTPTQ